ncbi:hypothetical protein [Planococcus shixiaomingii]|uniref:hypothetical protein n=1 Tax=Planococcus shixiaomingii TaxID=3058393 RepID=UPI0026061AE0|nr:hypothetical protein [Planococcus sp. N022]WKA56221.1 hypothetical protein QWY21_07730 [Planococcus sp. N022]
MKKASLLLTATLLLVACGGEQSAEVEQDTEDVMKQEAIEIDFVAANDDSIPAGTIVKAQGIATPITGTEIGDEFLLTPKEAEGEESYVVSNNSKVEIQDGQEISVYGSYDGKTDSGAPKITATIIE